MSGMNWRRRAGICVMFSVLVVIVSACHIDGQPHESGDTTTTTKSEEPITVTFDVQATAPVSITYSNGVEGEGAVELPVEEASWSATLQLHPGERAKLNARSPDGSVDCDIYGPEEAADSEPLDAQECTSSASYYTLR